MWGKSTRKRLEDAERTLAALVEAVNANADEHARRQGEILAALASQDGKVADLAGAVQTMMHARAEHDAAVAGHAATAAADAKAARQSAEASFAGVQSVAAVVMEHSRVVAEMSETVKAAAPAKAATVKGGGKGDPS
jgi:hypothetical protein